MNEKLQNYALIAEIISVIAVVLSLLYVGYQIQLNTAERRAESIQSLNAGYRELALIYVNNKEAGIAWHKLLEGKELTKREVDMMADTLYANLMLLEDTYNQHKAGYVDYEFLESKRAVEKIRLTRSPQLQAAYEIMKQEEIFTASFINWLDSKLEETTAGSGAER